jgi:hypothetical protein
VQTTHPGTIQLDGDTATGRAYIQELARARGGRQGLNYAKAGAQTLAGLAYRIRGSIRQRAGPSAGCAGEAW